MNYTIADKILKQYYEIHPNIEHIHNLCNELNIAIDKETIRIIEFLKREDYIDHEGGLHYKIGDHAINILEDYGCLHDYYKLIEEEKEEAKRLSEISTNKLINDARLSRWQVRTFWPVFFIGLIGGILGTISFFRPYITKEKVKLQQHTVKQMLHGDTTKTEKQTVYKPIIKIQKKK